MNNYLSHDFTLMISADGSSQAECTASPGADEQRLRPDPNHGCHALPHPCHVPSHVSDYATLPATSTDTGCLKNVPLQVCPGPAYKHGVRGHGAVPLALPTAHRRGGVLPSLTKETQILEFLGSNQDGAESYHGECIRHIAQSLSEYLEILKLFSRPVSDLTASGWLSG